MHELFENIAVDGSTSTIPGYDGLADPTDGDREDEGQQDGTTDKDSIQTPRSTTSSRKRSISTADIATSTSKGLHVPKRSSSSVAGVMQSMVEQLQLVHDRDKQTLETIAENLLDEIRTRAKQLQKKKDEKRLR
jgi:hypothetical protein